MNKKARNKIKRLTALILLFCVFTFSTASSESATAQLTELYAEAELLMVTGQYAEAAEKFDSLGAYSDASKMAMYCKAIACAESYNMYDVAVETLEKLGDFKDCIQLTQYYKARAYEAAGDSLLNKGDNITKADLAEADNHFSDAITIYRELALFKDCMVRMQSCIDKQTQIAGSTLDIKQAKYEEGLKKREDKDWDGAVSAFREAGDYSDAAEQINVTRYMEAEAKRAEHDWDLAEFLFTMLFDYSDAAVQIKETHYQHAKSLYDDGDFEAAYVLFKELTGYSDVDEILTNDINMVSVRESRQSQFTTKGNIVHFGHYEQDSNQENGPEEIEWIVLDVQDDKCLLISKYSLEIKGFNDRYTEVTWADCSLRKWLNGEFAQKAFSESEQAAILTTDVDNSSKQSKKGTKVSSGKNTQDKVFVLSYHEAFEEYFTTNTSRICSPTEKVLTGKKQKPKNEWWLRTRADNEYGTDASFVKDDGTAGRGSVNYSGTGVRPALWIDLNSDFF